MIEVLNNKHLDSIPHHCGLISVIMPVYNNEAFIKGSIQSIQDQTYQNFELLIIDDGSTDNTHELIQEYSKKDERIKLFKNKTNQGVSISRNIAYKQASGEFIAVMDSDDICFENRFQKQLGFLKEHPDVDVVGSQAIEFSEGNKKNNLCYPLSHGLIMWGFLFGRTLCHPTIIMRRRIIDDHNIQYDNQVVAHDYDLLIRLSKIAKLANVPDVLLMKRKHSHNLSSKNIDYQKHEVYNIIRSQVKDLIEENIPDEVLSGIILAKHQKIHPSILSVKTAREVSRVLTKLMRKALTWDLTDEDRFYIKQNTASRLRRIWQEMHYHPFLWPYVLYSFYLDPDIINRKLRPIIPK